MKKMTNRAALFFLIERRMVKFVILYMWTSYLLLAKLGFSVSSIFIKTKNILLSEKDERDLVILRHDIGIVWPDNRKEVKGINLVVYGDASEHSAMAKTVGYPAAIATRMILDGEIQQRGVILPFATDIYEPILSRLRAEGIISTETSKIL
ncbi:alpha-aminoadipic semialdehyde synthase, mitochondrial-like [Agrilus planipennis]|uniref:Alpha-aminoadipic semialdehyde synthase, mitochondrial-like n=1 Tax=Agrilus planipennis TaxID=224129 RepID=A0A1W4XQR8_AGRPL|nr:alpha-aminoadipic semialdehyde synthase, mitochondrial-like [Agrilus planipennis]